MENTSADWGRRMLASKGARRSHRVQLAKYGKLCTHALKAELERRRQVREAKELAAKRGEDWRKGNADLTGI